MAAVGDIRFPRPEFRGDVPPHNERGMVTAGPAGCTCSGDFVEKSPPYELLTPISWLCHEIRFGPPEFRGVVPRNSVRRTRRCHPYLRPYLLVASCNCPVIGPELRELNMTRNGAILVFASRRRSPNGPSTDQGTSVHGLHASHLPRTGAIGSSPLFQRAHARGSAWKSIVTRSVVEALRPRDQDAKARCDARAAPETNRLSPRVRRCPGWRA